MLVTPSGMVMEVRLVQSENALFPMLVTPSGMTTSPEQVVPSIRIPFTITKESSSCFWLNQDVPSNAPSPMLVTLYGMVMEVRLEQLENALLPILVKLSGMVIEVRLVQP